MMEGEAFLASLFTYIDRSNKIAYLPRYGKGIMEQPGELYAILKKLERCLPFGIM